MELVTMTQSRMLDEFRRALGMSVLRTDCTVQAVEGVEVDPWLEQLLDGWYTEQLLTADARLLPVTNQSQSAATSAMHGGMLRVRPDAQRVRVLAVQMADWTHAVEPVAFEQAGELLARMASPYSAPGPGSPLAVLMPDGSLQLCPDGEGGLTNLLCVTDPRPLYTFHPALLNTIVPYVNRVNNK
ncbi:MAG: hypothetical protein K2M61_01980 [Muribaculaceae bacterium]|nr:hypothetical protein [Muribaculaceae bacterium]